MVKRRTDPMKLDGSHEGPEDYPPFEPDTSLPRPLAFEPIAGNLEPAFEGGEMYVSTERLRIAPDFNRVFKLADEAAARLAGLIAYEAPESPARDSLCVNYLGRYFNLTELMQRAADAIEAKEEDMCVLARNFPDSD